MWFVKYFDEIKYKTIKKSTLPKLNAHKEGYKRPKKDFNELKLLQHFELNCY